MESNPVHMASQRMARLAIGSILYQCRIGRVQKQALDVFAHVLSQMIEALLRHATSFASGTPSTILYDGFEEEEQGRLVSLRMSPDFPHEASSIMDMAMTCLAVNPSSFLFLSGLSGNSWNPDYALTELLEYARVQTRFSEGQQDSLKRLMEQAEPDVAGRWNRSTDRLPKSIFENHGFINVAYSMIPRPLTFVEEIPASTAGSVNGSTSNGGALDAVKIRLDPIREETV